MCLVAVKINDSEIIGGLYCFIYTQTNRHPKRIALLNSKALFCCSLLFQMQNEVMKMSINGMSIKKQMHIYCHEYSEDYIK